MPVSNGPTDRLGRAATIVALLLTAAAATLHVAWFVSAGALWRDETSSVSVATVPALGDLWQHLAHDSFPALLPLVLRTWNALGLAGSDQGFRAFGLLVGAGSLAAFWIAARSMGRSVPLLALALFGTSSALVSYGDAVRGYGLGGLLGVLTLAAVWRLVERPSARRFACAALLATLGVQALFQNAFLVLAVCLAGALAALPGSRRLAASVLLVGLLPLVSLLPYLPSISRAQSWWIVEKTGFDLRTGWEAASRAAGSEFPFVRWIWVALVVIGLAGVVVQTLWQNRSGASRPTPAARYAGAALILGVAGYVLFLELARLPTQPWYYLPLLAFIAACLDPLAQGLPRHAWAGVVTVATVVAAMCLPQALVNVACRQTNVDSIAELLRTDARSGDLVLVTPWYCSITFARYYRGAAEWVSLPPLADYRMHRYDLLKQQMASRNPNTAVLDRLERTLRGGGRVWIVGGLRIPPRAIKVPDPQPAPHPRWGWSDVPYISIWSAQAGARIASAAAGIEQVAVPGGTRINPYEHLPLHVAWGAP